MGKTILILGAGAQGSTVARMMDREEGVSSMICADTDTDAVNELADTLDMAEGREVDAGSRECLAEAAEGADLIVNALPLRFAPDVMEAALSAGADYQDFAATDVLDPWWPSCIEKMYGEYGQRFREEGRTAVIGTGSSPGMMCVAARKTVEELDSCDDILMMVYEGVEAKRFLPFWWSPFTALSDMTDPVFALKDGRLIETEPFSLPVTRHFRGCSRPVRLVEHAHDEPVYMGLHRDTLFKGAKNINFKYGGTGIEFAEPLYRAGLLERKERSYRGHTFIPFDVVVSSMPPAPKYSREIEEILDEGLVRDEGAFVIEATGERDGRKVMAETYITAPGCAESFRRAGLTAEQYMTGQCGALFTKMLVRGEIRQKGLISTDMLTDDECRIYLTYARDLDICLETEMKHL